MIQNLAHLGNFWQQCWAHTQEDFVELLAKMVVHWKKNFINSIQCKMFIHTVFLSLAYKAVSLWEWNLGWQSQMQKVKRQSRSFLSISWGLVIVHTFIFWDTVRVPSRLQYIYSESISTIAVPCSFVILFLLEFDPCPPIAMGGNVLQLLVIKTDEKISW